MRNAKGTHKQPRTPRRAAQFWSPLNTWWRSYLSEHNRRPCTSELQEWFNQNADQAWPSQEARPTWKEARIHAKCLRSTEQVKQYFREYRARGKAGQGEGSKQQAEQQNSGDTGVFENSTDLPPQGGLLMVGQVQQGAPDTMELLVASHNARLNELNGTLASLSNLGSPFAAQTLSPNAFFNAPRASLAPPVWQQGKASSERFTTATRTSILDGLGAALGDRSLSFGAGSLGASVSFPNRGEKASSPFSVPGSLNRERVSCPTPHSADLCGTWSDGMLHTTTPANAHGVARHRRLTEFAHLPGTSSDPQPSGSGLRYTRSFTIQGTGLRAGPGHPQVSPDEGRNGRSGADWDGNAATTDLHGGEGGDNGDGMHSLNKKELLRLVAQDALGSDSRRSSAGTQGAAPAAMAAMRASRRPDSGNSAYGQPESEFAELWALEEEPATEAPRSTGHPPLVNTLAYLQDATAQQLQAAGMLGDRASAASDPGPAHPQYPRGGSIPSASPRTSCLSTDGPSHPFQLLSSFQRGSSHVRGPLGIASAVAAAAANAAALANRRSSETGSDGPPLPGSHRSSLPAGLFSRDYSRPLLVSELPSRGEQVLTWQSVQDQQHHHGSHAFVPQQQQVIVLQNQRLQGSPGPMSGRDREALQQQQQAVAAHNGRLWPQRVRASDVGQSPQSEMPGGQAGQTGRPMPWLGEMEWDRPTM